MVGLALLAAAAVYLLADPTTLKEFGDNISRAPLWATAVVVVGPLVNWVFVGLCLHALVRRHGEVGRGEMLALVGSAWLLNHLPMRPGLVGRIGYHAKVNKIRVRDSIEASVWSMVLAALANAIALGIVLILPGDTPLMSLVLILLIPLGVFLLLAMLAFTHSDRLGYLMLGLVFRNADLLVWMIRYAAGFVMLGVTITPIQIVVITAVSQVAQVIPITGGGFGFREWGVGIAAKMSASGTAITMRTAIGADVINRIAETIIVIPLGLFCTAVVARRYSAWSRSQGQLHDKAQEEMGSSEDEPAGHAQHKYEPRESGE